MSRSALSSRRGRTARRVRRPDSPAAFYGRSGDELLLDTGSAYGPLPYHDEYEQSLAANGSATLMLWTDWRGNGMLAARIDSNGVLLDSANIELPALGEGENSLFPEAASDGVDYLAIWDQSDSLFGARIAGNGSLLDTVEFAVAPGAAPDYSIAFGGGVYAVVWRDAQGAFATRVSTEGRVLDPRGIILAPGVQVAPSVAFDGTNFLAVWDSSGVRFSPAGQVLDTIPIQFPWTGASFSKVAFGGTNYLVAWQDASGAISASRVNRAGIPLDTAGIIVATGNTGFFDVAADSQRSIVVWAEVYSIPSIYGARLTPDGVLIDSTPLNLDLQATDTNMVDFPHIVRTRKGFLAAWDASFDLDYVCYVRFTFEGAVLDTTPIDPAGGTYASLGSSAASDSTNYFVAWFNDRPGDCDIYGTRVTPQGDILDPQTIPIGKAGVSTDVTVAFDGTNYLVAWVHLLADSSEAVCAARVTPAGIVLDSGGFPVSHPEQFIDAPSLSFGGTDYLVSWWGQDAGPDLSIRAARIAPSGKVLDTGGILISRSWPLGGPACASDGTNWLVVWTDSSAGRQNMYGARLDPAGKAMDSSRIAVSRLPVDEWDPTVIYDGANYAAFWDDCCADGFPPCSLYFNRITPAGGVLDGNGVRVTPAVDVNVYTSVAEGQNYMVMDDVWVTGLADVHACSFNHLGQLISSSIVVGGPGDQLARRLTRGPRNSLLLTYDGYLGRYHGRTYNTMRPWAKLGPFTGVVEGCTPRAERIALSAGVVRGVLFVGPGPSPAGRQPFELLDIAGRKVMGLQPGPNDVSRVAPGVYFVREQRPAKVKQTGLGTIRKVVLMQ